MIWSTALLWTLNFLREYSSQPFPYTSLMKSTKRIWNPDAMAVSKQDFYQFSLFFKETGFSYNQKKSLFSYRITRYRYAHWRQVENYLTLKYTAPSLIALHLIRVFKCKKINYFTAIFDIFYSNLAVKSGAFFILITFRLYTKDRIGIRLSLHNIFSLLDEQKCG